MARNVVDLSLMKKKDCLCVSNHVPCWKTHPSPVQRRHGTVDVPESNHLIPFDPVHLSALALVQKNFELSLRSELRVLRDDADVAVLVFHDTLLHIARHRNRIDGRAADDGFGILKQNVNCIIARCRWRSRSHIFSEKCARGDGVLQLIGIVGERFPCEETRCVELLRRVVPHQNRFRVRANNSNE